MGSNDNFQVYKITNLINGRIYIGSTTLSLKKRFGAHASGNKQKTLIHFAIKKYGRDNFKIETLEICSSKKELYQKEAEYIRNLKSLAPNGYNLHDNKFLYKDGAYIGKMNKKCQEAARKANTGAKRTEESKKLMSESAKKRGANAKMRPIKDNLGNIYESINQAARITKFNVSDIHKSLTRGSLIKRQYKFFDMENK
jgi:group I intron endonuclease